MIEFPLVSIQSFADKGSTTTMIRCLFRFKASETDELKMACPIACGLCTDTEAEPKPIAPTTQTQKESGMEMCFDDSCADDPLYVGKLNIRCETISSGSYDCTKFGVMSYVSL